VFEPEGVVWQGAIVLVLLQFATLVVRVLEAHGVELVEECEVRHRARHQAVLVQERQDSHVVLMAGKQVSALF